MIYLNLTPKFKYSPATQLSYTKQFSIYIQNTARSVHENNYPVQSWNPTSIFFRKLNTTVHDSLKPYTTVQNATLLNLQNSDILNKYSATKSISVHKNDQYV